MGLVKLGTISVDGTEVKANASRHKAMSYGHMLKAEAEALVKHTDAVVAVGREGKGGWRVRSNMLELPRGGGSGEHCIQPLDIMVPAPG